MLDHQCLELGCIDPCIMKSDFDARELLMKEIVKMCEEMLRE